jgi:signal transduction histidine kinase
MRPLIINQLHRVCLGLLLASTACGITPAVAGLVIYPFETDAAPLGTIAAGFWELHRWPIFGTVMFCLLQAALIIGLLVNRAKRRQGEAMATLIAEISSKFVNLPASEVDSEIMNAERQICEFLNLDISALWQWSAGHPGCFTLTHYFSAQDGPQPSMQLRDTDFPWFRQLMLDGRIVPITSLDDMPAQAALDRENCLRLGVKSNLCIPLVIGGEPIGILGLNTVRAQRKWPDQLVKQLQLIAQVFANALARKHADQALRESELRMAAGTELAGIGYYEVDFGKCSMFVDDRFHEICGVPAGHQQGLQSLEFWLVHLHPADRQFILDERDRLHTGKIDRLSIEYRYLHPVGGLKWIHHLAGAATRSATGQAVRTYGVVRDVTQQRLAEQEALELRGNLTHAGRVTLLGQLASALAHELNQPLGAILRNAEAAAIMLQASAPDLLELRAIINDILSDDTRAGCVIDRLRSLLKRRNVETQPIDLPNMIGEVLTLINADAATRHVRIAFPATPDLPMVMGDRVHLQQVLLNLLMNAMDALDATPPDQRAIQLSANRVGPYTVEVRVTDNGPGISGESMERLFEPFFTTKSNGLGLGLPVSKTIIEAHKGCLWAEHGPAGGACFCFTVPVAEQQK